MKLRKILPVVLCLIIGAILIGCNKESDIVTVADTEWMKETISGTEISPENISDFYYTYDNINFGAHYQRYRFYTEDGKYMFFHETRDVGNDYGPATEEDRTAIGTVELSEAQWKEFWDLIKDGKVRNRQDSAESGGRGPWMYIYYDGGTDNGQEFYFADGKQGVFETFCENLAK